MAKTHRFRRSGLLGFFLLTLGAWAGAARGQSDAQVRVEDLRFGTVAINCWAAVGYGLVVTPWGAYPGRDVYDIQSGSGFVHNTLMFDRIQKTAAWG